MTLFLGFQNCGDSNIGFNLASEYTTFQQEAVPVHRGLDILWVVDNSGSMAPEQRQLARHFQSFIEKFQTYELDYQMAVTTTDTWCADVLDVRANCAQAYTNHMRTGEHLARFRKGTSRNPSQARIITPLTPDLEETFIANVTQGNVGGWDERALQSAQTALSHPPNLAEPFPRPGSLLVVIIVTDDIDLSLGALDPGDDPQWFPGKDYFDFYYKLTNSREDQLNFVINLIGIVDEACLLEQDWFAGDSLEDILNVLEHSVIPGVTRNSFFQSIELVDQTNGYKDCISNDFSDVLSELSQSITNKVSLFKLNREPNVDSIVVRVNGQVIPRDDENGWDYHPSTMEISLHGEALYQWSSSEHLISISFDPLGLK